MIVFRVTFVFLVDFFFKLDNFMTNMVFITQMAFNSFLFFIALIHIFLNRRNYLLILISIEVLMLSLILSFLIFSVYYQDIIGIIFSLFILAIAASESAMGLALIILQYKTKGTVHITNKLALKC